MVEIYFIECTKKEADLAFNLWKYKNKKTVKKLLKKECEFCGDKRNIHLHHDDGDKRNNKIANLIPICWKCHSEIHKNFFQVRYLDSNKKLWTKHIELMAEFYYEK